MSRDAPRRYLVAYDVGDDRRRERVAKRLSSYGDRIQFSVFIVDARPAKIVRLTVALSRLIDVGIDSILFCDLGPLSSDPATRFEFLGQRRRVTSDGILVV